ncbi:hypothetical protein EI94DRAFT_1790828, partial [Lactarius quietus]
MSERVGTVLGAQILTWPRSSEVVVTDDRQGHAKFKLRGVRFHLANFPENKHALTNNAAAGPYPSLALTSWLGDRAFTVHHGNRQSPHLGPNTCAHYKRRHFSKTLSYGGDVKWAWLSVSQFSLAARFEKEARRLRFDGSLIGEAGKIVGKQPKANKQDACDDQPAATSDNCLMAIAKRWSKADSRINVNQLLTSDYNEDVQKDLIPTKTSGLWSRVCGGVLWEGQREGRLRQRLQSLQGVVQLATRAGPLLVVWVTVALIFHAKLSTIMASEGSGRAEGHREDEPPRTVSYLAPCHNCDSGASPALRATPRKVDASTLLLGWWLADSERQLLNDDLNGRPEMLED